MLIYVKATADQIDEKRTCDLCGDALIYESAFWIETEEYGKHTKTVMVCLDCAKPIPKVPDWDSIKKVIDDTTEKMFKTGRI